MLDFLGLDFSDLAVLALCAVTGIPAFGLQVAKYKKLLSGIIQVMDDISTPNGEIRKAAIEKGINEVVRGLPLGPDEQGRK